MTNLPPKYFHLVPLLTPPPPPPTFEPYPTTELIPCAVVPIHPQWLPPANLEYLSRTQWDLRPHLGRLPDLLGHLPCLMDSPAWYR